MKPERFFWACFAGMLFAASTGPTALCGETQYVKLSKQCQDSTSRTRSAYFFVSENVPGAKAVFAMSESYNPISGGDNAANATTYVARYCGWATNYLPETKTVDETVTWAELERQAVAACLEDRGPSGFPCLIIARNGEIQYSRSEKRLGSNIAGKVPGRPPVKADAETAP